MPVTRQPTQEPKDEIILRNSNSETFEMASELNAAINELITALKEKSSGESTASKKMSVFKPEKQTRKTFRSRK